MHARRTVPTSEGVPQQKPSKALVCISPQYPQSLTGSTVGQAAPTKPERWVCSISTEGLTAPTPLPQPGVVAQDEELEVLFEERHARRRKAAARLQAAIPVATCEAGEGAGLKAKAVEGRVLE